MANNHPPFPFPYPHMQQMQQPPNGAHHDGQPHPQHPQHPQHPPPPPPGWNLPGLHQQYPPPQPYMPQPGHAENQNNMPQFPSAALWPPQIPPEWLQLMQNGMQSGMVPPPMPGLTFPPPSLPQTPQAPTTPMAFPPHFPTRPTAGPVERVHEVADTDREDGEVSDAEGALRTPAGIAVRQRYPEPPRSAPQPMSTPSHAADVYNPEKPSAGQTSRTSKPKGAQQASAAVNEMDLVQHQREEAKQFIRLLNSNNIGYHALAKENIDIELLRAMYRSMNLPSEPEPIPPPKTKGAPAPESSSQVLESPATSSVPSASQKTAPAVSTNVAATSVANATASPVDRKDYLARLQAAKLARQSGPAKASPPSKSPPATAASSITGISTPQATSTPTRKQPATDEQKARQTELIKQRLEALKAQSKQSATAPSATQNFAPQQSVTKPPHTPGTNMPTQQPSAPGFPGIPGLFMNAASSSSNGTTTPSKQAQSVPQKRYAPSDTEASTPRGSVTPYNRPFGHSPYVQQEDSMIIEVSDDESNGSDMDIDDDQVSTAPPVIRQAPLSVPGFPPRQTFAPAVQSAASTPGPQTPATLARTGELNTKEQELAALRLTLKKKLAEQKRIKEAAEAAAVAAAAASHGASSNEHEVQLSSATPAQHSQVANHSRAPVAHATIQAGASAVDSSRDRKRRRRTEIQEQLPSLDDEIASNEAEMARLAKDLERLKANNERIVQDKERLTKELEDLGIDTEGMSHADMQATKNEIERAMSPGTDTIPKSASARSQSSLPNGESKAPASASAETADDTGYESTPQAQPPVSNQANPQYGFLPGIGQAAPQTSAPAASHPPPQSLQEPARSVPGELQAGADGNDPAGTAINAQASNDRASATPMDDDEDFYSPPPPAEVSADVEPNAAKVPEARVDLSIANAPSPSEEGEVEMSESSEEEEYEPDELIVDESALEPRTEKVQPLEPQVTQSQSVGQSQVSTEDEEAYEPPDVEEEMTEVAPTTDALQVEALSPGDADDGAMDIATSSSELEDSESDSGEETHSELGESGSEMHATQQDTHIANDLAPELQPETLPTTTPVVAHSDDIPIIEEEPEMPRFTPYESPLRMFKSYRYHPNFSQDVDGGFLSMTFSHQIDPETPLCPFESAGGSCNDPECPNQHFRGMGINGEKLLVQLGTANPGKTQDERQQWNNGLRSVLQDLRQKNIKDPNGIAREIAKYRRQFLKDETRVVNL